METIALLISFVLWKIFAIVGGLLFSILPSAIIAVMAFCIHSEFDAYGDLIKPPSKLAKQVWLAIIIVLAIPYNNMFWNSFIAKDITAKLDQGWDAHVSKATEKPPTKINVKNELRRFELVHWNPPKHFYVTLRDVAGGALYEDVYVSKHCNLASNLKHGEEYNLQITTYNWSNDPNTPRSEFSNLYEAFCRN